MSIRVREYTDADYPIFLDWWKARGWKAMPREILSKMGMVAVHDFRDIAAGWVYLFPDSKMALVAWFVTNPTNTVRESVQGLQAVASSLQDIALAHGHNIVVTTCPEGSLARFLEGEGFIRTDSCMVEFIKAFPPKQYEEVG